MSGNRHRILQASAPEFHHWPRENLDAEDEPAAHSSGRLRQLLRASGAPRGSRWRGTAATADRRGDAGGSGRGRVGLLRGAQTRRPVGDAHCAGAPPVSRSRGGSRAEGCVRAAQPGSSARAGRGVARGQTGFHRRILSGSLGDGEDAGRRVLRRLARRIRDTVLARTGISVSAGGGTRRLIAKLATGLAKPAGVCIVPPGEESEFMQRFDLEDIPGIGPAFRAALERRSLRSVADVLRVQPEWLERWFGARRAPLAARPGAGTGRREHAPGARAEVGERGADVCRRPLGR